MAGEVAYNDSHGLAAPGGHYSNATRAGGLLFVSGQLPIARDGTKLTDQSFEKQTLQTLANVSAALASAGRGIESLVQVRVYITNLDNWSTFNSIYSNWIGLARPARAVVPVSALHYGFQIEIEAVAISSN